MITPKHPICDEDKTLVITPGAQLALRDGDFNALERSLTTDGIIFISVNEETYREKYGPMLYPDRFASK